MWSIVSPSIAALSLSSILFSPLAVAQTFTNCNPLTSGNCPPDPALGKAAVIDFTKGSVDSFSALGTPTYDGNGVSFTVAKPGDSPQIVSKFYIMFGRVDITLKAAPGSGIVSSAVLQSDDLDEIDWEWLGADSSQVQTNYFGKGITGSYNRGAFHPNPGNQASFKTYTVDWTANQIVWSIDGTSVRSLLPADAAGQYPQTPMQLKVGAWSGGDSTNSPGTIQWAHGPTVYSNGPFSMQVKSIAVTDYSTGTLYKYSGSDGTWQSIVAEGGKVNSGSSAPPPAPAASSSLSSQSTAAPSTAPAPAVTSTVPLVPPAFGGTHRETTTLSMPSGYPWIANPSTLQTTTIPTTYPGLPSGWTVSSSGKLIPASSASSIVSATDSSYSQLSVPLPSSLSTTETITSFSQQSSATTPASTASCPNKFDDKGFSLACSGATSTATQQSTSSVSSQTGSLSKSTVSNTAASYTLSKWTLGLSFLVLLHTL